MSMAGRNWWLKNNYDVFYTVDMFRLLNSVETVLKNNYDVFYTVDMFRLLNSVETVVLMTRR